MAQRAWRTGGAAGLLAWSLAACGAAAGPTAEGADAATTDIAADALAATDGVAASDVAPGDTAVADTTVPDTTVPDTAVPDASPDTASTDQDAATGSDSTAGEDSADSTGSTDAAWWETLQQETPAPLAVVGQLPCLDYDGVADGTTDQYVLPTQLFFEHIVWMYTHGYTAWTMEQYIQRIDDPDFAKKGLPPRTVLLFSDVTSAAFLKNAWPILYPLGYRVTLGIETALLGEPWAMTVAQLKGLEKLGIEIACHTHTHPDLTQISAEQLQDEVAGSRQKLQAYGFAVPHFIHPYGMRNALVDKAIVDAGFTAARSTGAPTIAGGGYTGLDPKRRLALGCALPTQTTTVGELETYLTNPRIELEDVVGVLADVGTEGPVERGNFVSDHYLSTSLPDKGDKVRVRLLVNQPGTYDLIWHVKVGFPGVPDGSNDSYLYRVNGQDVAKELLGPDAEEPPYIVWGKHKLAKLQLAQGLVDIEIESGGDWDVVLDWLEVVPSP